MKKFPVFLAILLVVFAPFCVAQGTFLDGDFFPYVSQINLEVRNNLIRLTWVDSPDAKGPVYIFRSARPFSGSVPANLRPVVVRYGEQYHIDDTEDMENVYYFIAASDISGRRYDTIIPELNSVILNRSQPDMPVMQIPLENIASGSDGISNIRARPDGEGVIITYNMPDQRKNAILYRSAWPVSQPQDLLNAVIVQSGFDSMFVDFPVPGFPWYYAVVFEDDISGGNLSITPGINATTSAVVISSEIAAEPSMRGIPLPLLTLHTDSFLSDVAVGIPLSADSVNMLSESRAREKAPLELKKPRVFIADLQAPAGGEESALTQIVNEYFEKLNWEEALINLRHYLSLPRSKDIEARARFYYGQTLYYTGNYREALFEFLTFRSYHPGEANSWIDAVLLAMIH